MGWELCPRYFVPHLVPYIAVIHNSRDSQCGALQMLRLQFLSSLTQLSATSIGDNTGYLCTTEKAETALPIANQSLGNE